MDRNRSNVTPQLHRMPRASLMLALLVAAPLCLTVVGNAQNIKPAGPVKSPRPRDSMETAPVRRSTFEGQPIVVEEEKFSNGRTSSFVEGVRDADGGFTRHGLSITFYESGHMRNRTLWRNGVPDGERTSWYFNGQVWSHGQFSGGLEDGTWERWHQNGVKLSEWHMRRGAWHGVYTEWHDNGKKRMEVEFVNGLRQGPMYMFDTQGVQISRSDFVDGVEQP